MDASDILDFALGHLEGLELARMEHAITTDPAFADRIGRLRRCVHLLLDDEWEEASFARSLIDLEVLSGNLVFERAGDVSCCARP